MIYIDILSHSNKKSVQCYCKWRMPVPYATACAHCDTERLWYDLCAWVALVRVIVVLYWTVLYKNIICSIIWFDLWHSFCHHNFPYESYLRSSILKHAVHSVDFSDDIIALPHIYVYINIGSCRAKYDYSPPPWLGDFVIKRPMNRWALD